MPPKAAAKKTKKKKAKRKAFDDVTNGAASSSAEKKTKKEKTFERVNVDDVFIADLQSAFAGLTEGAPSSGDERRAFFVNLVNNQRSITDELTRKLGVFELRSFPAATAEEIVSEICVFLLMNFDVPTNHPGNGVTNPKNGCVIWLRQGQWTAFEKFEMIKQADASTIAAKLLVMDRIPLITKVTEHGPDAEFVEIIRRASGGDAKAKAGGLLKQYYLMIMAMFELHACARGAPARVVGVGAESRKLCDCFWSTLSTVKVIGMIMHPDKWHRGPSKLEAAKITAEELDKSGFETERLEHVALDDCATNIARACGVQLLEGSGITFFTRCFDRIDPDIIKAVHDVRSQRMVEAWQPGGFMRLWWDSLTPQQQRDHMQGCDDWWDALTPQQKKQWGLDRTNNLPHMRDDWVSKYETEEDRREAHRARSAKRNAEVRTAELTCRLPDPPGQEPRECDCLLPEDKFSTVAPRELLKCELCCDAAAAILEDPARLLPKASAGAWFPKAKALARAANNVTKRLEKKGLASPFPSPFPRYDLECELFTPKATKERKERLAKSSESAGA